DVAAQPGRKPEGFARYRGLDVVRLGHRAALKLNTGDVGARVSECAREKAVDLILARDDLLRRVPDGQILPAVEQQRRLPGRLGVVSGGAVPLHPQPWKAERNSIGASGRRDLYPAGVGPGADDVDVVGARAGTNRHEPHVVVVDSEVGGRQTGEL